MQPAGRCTRRVGVNLIGDTLLVGGAQILAGRLSGDGRVRGATRRLSVGDGGVRGAKLGGGGRTGRWRRCRCKRITFNEAES